MERLKIVSDGSESSSARALIYARTSGRESKSIRDQIEIARARIKERGWTARFILDDAGKSGGNADRPGYQQLLKHASNQSFGVLVVWKIDRIARSIAEMTTLEEWLRSLGIMLHSCTEPIDTTTAQGRFMFGILASAGQLEREMASQRVEEVMAERARRGMWLHSIAPFGYCLGKNRALRIHPQEGGQVKQVFDVHAERGSYAEAAATLNQLGDRRRGRRWTAGTIQRVVENSICIGEYEHWKQAVHRPNLRIVTDEAWFRALRIRKENPRVGKPASQLLREQSIKRVFDQYIDSLASPDLQ